jgi:hypothetical protein
MLASAAVDSPTSLRVQCCMRPVRWRTYGDLEASCTQCSLAGVAQVCEDEELELLAILERLPAAP